MSSQLARGQAKQCQHEGPTSAVRQIPSAAPTAPTVVKRVTHEIGEAIIHGEFRPGAALPEIPLARRLSVSRGTVREALRALEDLGLVEIYPFRGAYVSQLEPRVAVEVFGLRSVLESYAARLAMEAGHIRGETLLGIRDAYADLTAAATAGDGLDVVEADLEFHRRISAVCGHQLLLSQLSDLEQLTRRYVVATKLYASDPEGEAQSHLPILIALESGDPVRAETAIRDHITRAGQNLLARMAEMEQSASRTLVQSKIGGGDDRSVLRKEPA
jgi:DNA-binding GntR family transcriptional regulator